MCTRGRFQVLTNQNQQRPIYSASSEKKKLPFLRNISDLLYYGKGWVGMSTKRMGVLEKHTENSI